MRAEKVGLYRQAWQLRNTVSHLDQEIVLVHKTFQKFAPTNKTRLYTSRRFAGLSPFSCHHCRSVRVFCAGVPKCYHQILAMSALINCVELKESADNCAAIARLAVQSPATARAVDDRMFGGNRRKREKEKLLPGVVGSLSSSTRCLAPEFLARLLIRCTRSFAHQLEADRPDGDGEEGPASPAPARMQQHAGRRTTDHSGSKDGAGSSTASSVAPTAAPAVSPAPATPRGEDGGEQLMSHAEGTDLVLGGHCALLLGLLVREEEANRCES